MEWRQILEKTTTKKQNLFDELKLVVKSVDFFIPLKPTFIGSVIHSVIVITFVHNSMKMQEI